MNYQNNKYMVMVLRHNDSEVLYKIIVVPISGE